MNDHEVFDPDDVVLQQGATLREAKLAYMTYRTLNEEKSSTVLFETGAPGCPPAFLAHGPGQLW